MAFSRRELQVLAEQMDSLWLEQLPPAWRHVCVAVMGQAFVIHGARTVESEQVLLGEMQKAFEKEGKHHGRQPKQRTGPRRRTAAARNHPGAGAALR